MCGPLVVPLIMLAVTAASAVMQNNQQNKAIEAQAKSQNKQVEAGYMADQQAAQAAQAQAFEERTDRANEAQRQLAMARVAAAEGRGSLASMAINITGAEADDLSRIDASTDNQLGSIRDRDAALQAGAADQMSALQVQGRASQLGAGLGAAQGAMSAAAMYYGNTTKNDLAKNNRPTLSGG